MKSTPVTTAQHLFKRFCDGYKYRDLPFLLNLFTKDIILWGSGIDEYRCGLRQVEEQLKRDWSQSEDGEIRILSFNPAPEHAFWASALCEAKIWIDGQHYIFEHLRGTICIDEENGNWKIAHMHSSFPDYRNARNGSFPVLA